MVIVLGNESADLDSAMSAIVLARLFNHFLNAFQPTYAESFERAIPSMDEEDQAACKTFLEIIRNQPQPAVFEAALPVSELRFSKTVTFQYLAALGLCSALKFVQAPFDAADYVLVDHNSSAAAEMHVVGCFDHHVLSFGSEEPPCSSYIRVPRASTCALIGQVCCQLMRVDSGNELLALARLLAIVIEIDSYEFAPASEHTRWVARDLDVFRTLGEKQDDELTALRVAISEVKKEYKASLADGRVDLHEVLLSDNKIFSYEGSRRLIYSSTPVKLRDLMAELDEAEVEREFDKFLRECSTKAPNDSCFIVTSKSRNHRELSLAGTLGNRGKFDELETVLDSLFPSHKWYIKRRKYGRWIYSCLKIDATNTRKIVEPLLRSAWR